MNSLSYSRSDLYFGEFPINDHCEKILNAVEDSPVTLVCGGVQFGKTLVLPQLLREVGERVLVGVINRFEVTRIVTFINSLGIRRCSERMGGMPKLKHSLQYMTMGRMRSETQRGLKFHDLEDCRSKDRPLVLVIDDVHVKTVNRDAMFFFLRNLMTTIDYLKVVLLSSFSSNHYTVSDIVPYFGKKNCRVIDLGADGSVARHFHYLEDILEFDEVEEQSRRVVAEVWDLHSPEKNRRLPFVNDCLSYSFIQLFLDIVGKIVLDEDYQNPGKIAPSYDILVHIPSIDITSSLIDQFNTRLIRYQGSEKPLSDFFNDVVIYNSCGYRDSEATKTILHALKIMKPMQKEESRRYLILVPSDGSNSVHFPNVKYIIDFGVFSYRFICEKDFSLKLHFADQTICRQRSNRGGKDSVRVFLFQPKEFVPKKILAEIYDNQVHQNKLIIEAFSFSKRFVSQSEFINVLSESILERYICQFRDRRLSQRGEDGIEVLTEAGVLSASLNIPDFRLSQLVIWGMSCDLLFEALVLAILVFKGPIVRGRPDNVYRILRKEDKTCTFIANLEVFVKSGVFDFFGVERADDARKNKRDEEVLGFLLQNSINPGRAFRVCRHIKVLLVNLENNLSEDLKKSINWREKRSAFHPNELNLSKESKLILKSLLHGCFLDNSVIRKSVSRINFPPSIRNPDLTARLRRVVVRERGDVPSVSYELGKNFKQMNQEFLHPVEVLRFFENRSIGNVMKWWILGKPGKSDFLRQSMFVEFDNQEAIDLVVRHFRSQKRNCPYVFAETTIKNNFIRLFAIHPVVPCNISVPVTHHTTLEKEKESNQFLSGHESEYTQGFIFSEERFTRSIYSQKERVWTTFGNSQFPDLSLIVKLLLFSPRVYPCSLIGRKPNSEDEEFVAFKMNDMIVFYDLKSSNALDEPLSRKIKEYRSRIRRFPDIIEQVQSTSSAPHQSRNPMSETRELLSSILKESKEKILGEQEGDEESPEESWMFFNKEYLKVSEELDNWLVMDYLHKLQQGESIGVEVLPVPHYVGGERDRKYPDVIMLRMSKKIKKSSSRFVSGKGSDWDVMKYLTRLIDVVNQNFRNVFWDGKKRLFVCKT